MAAVSQTTSGAVRTALKGVGKGNNPASHPRNHPWRKDYIPGFDIENSFKSGFTLDEETLSKLTRLKGQTKKEQPIQTSLCSCGKKYLTKLHCIWCNK